MGRRFRLAADSADIKNPDSRSGKVVVQSHKGGSKNTVLALMGEDLAPF